MSVCQSAPCGSTDADRREGGSKTAGFADVIDGQPLSILLRVRPIGIATMVNESMHILQRFVSVIPVILTLQAFRALALVISPLSLASYLAGVNSTMKALRKGE